MSTSSPRLAALWEHAKGVLRWVRSAFEESPGVASSMRICLFAACTCVLSIWTLSSYRLGKPAPMDPPVLGLISVFVCGKVAQRYGEGA